ncbi:MAG: hypothetical protein ACI9DH_000723 [Halioglobus sp.]|jgi:hypothetical protein
MSDKTQIEIGGLTFTDNISIDWKPVDCQPDDSRLALVNESNESFLRAVSALGAFSTDGSEDEVGLSQEILRLDLKVNLLLDLVSQLIYQQLEIPGKSEVTISSTSIQWRASKVPPPGIIVFVQVYIQHGTPKPLCFYGKVQSSQEQYESGLALVSYLGLSGSVQSWLDKLIFRHHRRAIAFSKSQLPRTAE